MATIPPNVIHRTRPLPRLSGLAVGVATLLWIGGCVIAAGQMPASTPARIVSFVPAVTEMLFAIGAGERVVGVSDYDRHPPEVLRLAKVGGLLDPSLERVLSLRPDLVVTYATQRELRAQLTRAQLPEFAYVHRDLADVTATIRTLGTRVGAVAGANQLADGIERELEAIRRQVQGRPRPRTLLVFGREANSLRRIHASGGYGFLHDLLEIAGGADVMADVKRQSVELSTETVLARAPDVIIELKYGQELAGADLTRLEREWDVLASVPAVRQRRVRVLQGDEFVVPGPRVVHAARQLADAIHPSATAK